MSVRPISIGWACSTWKVFQLKNGKTTKQRLLNFGPFWDQKGQQDEITVQLQLYACFFFFYFLCFKSLQTTENFQGIWLNIKCFKEGLKILNEYQTHVERILKVICFMKGASNLKLVGSSVWAKNDFSVWNDQGWQKDN